MSTFKLDNIVWRSGELAANSQYSVTADKIVWGVAKAWCNYNGGGPSTRLSFNISSVTRNAAGDYTFNTSTALADTNYITSWSGNGPTLADYNNNFEAPYTTAPTSSAIRCFMKDNGQAGAVGRDCLYGYISFLR